MIKFLDDELLNFTTNKLYKKLTEGLYAEQLVNITGMREIGKTTALVRFAIERDIPVLEPTDGVADLMRKRFHYEKIYSIGSIRGLAGITEVVIDEGVSLDLAKADGVKVITGYFNKLY